ncbi:hypothetical protein TWF694_010138 [Orbilia ellipsospora]|uniref:Peptidase A1 domain-containing protein n=1 Tax=Orbilia ellipsospora TaxID=2528407 RepID=A0AAV9XBM0_9PEZI
MSILLITNVYAPLEFSYTVTLQLNQVELEGTIISVLDPASKYGTMVEAQGYLGLGSWGYGDTATSHPGTVLSQMVSKSYINSQTVGIHLDNVYNQPANQDIHGSILFGGIDRAKFEGQIGTYNLTLENPALSNVSALDPLRHPMEEVGQSIKINLLNFTFGSTLSNDTVKNQEPGQKYLRGKAFLDLSNRYIELPDVEWGLLVEELNNSGHLAQPATEYSEKLYLQKEKVDDTAQSYGLNISFPGDLFIPILYQHMSVLDSKSDTYELLIKKQNPNLEPRAFVLGAPFFRAAYVVLDYSNGYVNLAKSIQGTNDQDIIEIGYDGKNISTILNRVDLNTTAPTTLPTHTSTLNKSSTHRPTSKATSSPTSTPTSTTTLSQISVQTVIASTSIAGTFGGMFIITFAALIWTLTRNRPPYQPIILPANIVNSQGQPAHSNFSSGGLGPPDPETVFGTYRSSQGGSQTQRDTIHEERPLGFTVRPDHSQIFEASGSNATV